MTSDVLEKAPAQAGAKFSDDPLDVWPQVPRVLFTLALSRLGKRLAWISSEKGVDDAAPWACVESLEVVPDWGSVQVSGALACDERAARVFFDLDVTGGGKARLGKSKTHVKSAAACTEGEAVLGR